MTIPGDSDTAIDDHCEGEAAALVKLRRDFPGHRIFRGRDSSGEARSWVATLRDPDVGVDPTLIEQTAEDMRYRLEAERRRAQNGGWPPAEGWGL